VYIYGVATSSKTHSSSRKITNYVRPHTCEYAYKRISVDEYNCKYVSVYVCVYGPAARRGK